MQALRGILINCSGASRFLYFRVMLISLELRVPARRTMHHTFISNKMGPALVDEPLDMHPQFITLITQRVVVKILATC